MSGRAATNTVIPGKFALSVGDPGTPLRLGWRRVLLTDIAELGTGHTPSRRHQEYWGGDISWMGVRDAGRHHGGTIENTEETITEAGLNNSSARLLRAGTVCLSRTASVGYVVQLGRDMATSQDFVTWTCSAALDPRFLMWALLAEGQDVRAFGKGTTHTTIYFPEVKAFHLALPPLSEQRRIVAKLDALSARSKRARAELERVEALAARAREAVLAAAFTGHLTKDWRSSFRDPAPTDEALAALRSLAWDRRQAELGRSRRCPELEPIEWKPELELPHEWRWVSLDSVAPISEYGSSAKTSTDPSGVPVLRMGNIQGGQIVAQDLKYLPSDHEEFPTLLLADGDLLFNRTNSPELVGKSAVFEGIPEPCSFASYLIRLRTSGYHPKLLCYYINSPFGREWVRSVVTQQVGQANVNGTKLSRLALPLMSEEEQCEILAKVEACLAVIARTVADARAALKLVDRLGHSILSRAFRGELVPQDPTDEPASELLERIPAERRREVALQKRRRRRAGAAGG